MKLALLFALTVSAFAQPAEKEAAPHRAVAASLPTVKPHLTDAQKSALMMAKADQLQSENDAFALATRLKDDAEKQLAAAKERAQQSQTALEKLITETLKGIGCEGGQLVRQAGKPDIEVSCPPVPVVPK